MKSEIKQRSETKWFAGVIGCVALGATLLSPSSALALVPWTNYFQSFDSGEDWGGTTVQHASGTFGIPSSAGTGFGLVTPTGGSYPGFVNHGKSNTLSVAGQESPGRVFSTADLYLDTASGTSGQAFRFYHQNWWANAGNGTVVLALGTKTATGWSMQLADFFGSSASVNVTDTGWYTFKNVFEDNGFGYWKHTAQLIKKADGSTVLSQANNYNGYASQAITNYAGWIQMGFSLMDNINNPGAGYSGIAIDEVSIVPEPTVATLLTVTGVFLLRRKP